MDTDMIQILAIAIIGIALVIAAVSLILKRNKLTKSGVKAEGIVYDLARQPNSSFNTMYPVIRFLTETQDWITETANIGMWPGFYKKGEKVNVIYNPKNPKEFTLDSKSSTIILYVLLIIGSMLALFGLYKLITIEF